MERLRADAVGPKKTQWRKHFPYGKRNGSSRFAWVHDLVRDDRGMAAASYGALADLALVVHGAWILWVIFGAYWTRGRRWLSVVHIAALLWGIVAEAGPWPCPLTLLEQRFETQAGALPYDGSFLVYYLDRLVSPNVPETLLVVCALAVCAVNAMVYWRRWR
ncbi:MAG: DUF2784 domain-containing protein [Bryobacteraceae bacterium]